MVVAERHLRDGEPHSMGLPWPGASLLFLESSHDVETLPGLIVSVEVRDSGLMEEWFHSQEDLLPLVWKCLSETFS